MVEGIVARLDGHVDLGVGSVTLAYNGLRVAASCEGIEAPTVYSDVGMSEGGRPRLDGGSEKLGDGVGFGWRGTVVIADVEAEGGD